MAASAHLIVEHATFARSHANLDGGDGFGVVGASVGWPSRTEGDYFGLRPFTEYATPGTRSRMGAGTMPLRAEWEVRSTEFGRIAVRKIGIRDEAGRVGRYLVHAVVRPGADLTLAEALTVLSSAQMFGDWPQDRPSDARLEPIAVERTQLPASVWRLTATATVVAALLRIANTQERIGIIHAAEDDLETPLCAAATVLPTGLTASVDLSTLVIEPHRSPLALTFSDVALATIPRTAPTGRRYVDLNGAGTEGGRHDSLAARVLALASIGLFAPSTLATFQAFEAWVNENETFAKPPEQLSATELSYVLAHDRLVDWVRTPAEVRILARAAVNDPVIADALSLRAEVLGLDRRSALAWSVLEIITANDADPLRWPSAATRLVGVLDAQKSSATTTEALSLLLRDGALTAEHVHRFPGSVDRLVQDASAADLGSWLVDPEVERALLAQSILFRERFISAVLFVPGFAAAHGMVAHDVLESDGIAVSLAQSVLDAEPERSASLGNVIVENEGSLAVALVGVAVGLRGLPDGFLLSLLLDGRTLETDAEAIIGQWWPQIARQARLPEAAARLVTAAIPSTNRKPWWRSPVSSHYSDPVEAGAVERPSGAPIELSSTHGPQSASSRRSIPAQESDAWEPGPPQQAAPEPAPRKSSRARSIRFFVLAVLSLVTVVAGGLVAVVGGNGAGWIVAGIGFLAWVTVQVIRRGTSQRSSGRRGS